MDGSLMVISLIARGWLLTALLVLVGTEATAEALAVSLGGILLGFRALSVLTAGVSQLAGATIAWRQVASLVRAAARPAPSATTLQAGPLLVATGLRYQHPGREEPTLRDGPVLPCG